MEQIKSMSLQVETITPQPTENSQKDTETEQEMLFKKSRLNAKFLREKEQFKEHLKYLKKKDTKQLRSIKELSPREQEIRRQMWRLNSQKYRERKMRQQRQQKDCDSQQAFTTLHNFMDKTNDTTLEQDFLQTMFDTPKTEYIEIEDEGPPEIESDPQSYINMTCPTTSPPLIPNDYDSNSALELKLKERKRVRHSEPAETSVDRYLSAIQKSTDEHQVFGAFVAQELRSIKSEHLRKQLRRMIQRDILIVAEIEDNQTQTNFEQSDNYGESNSLN